MIHSNLPRRDRFEKISDLMFKFPNRLTEVEAAELAWYVGELVGFTIRALKLVDRQAEDEGLWFKAETIAEAYVQQALRDLHAEIEGTETITRPRPTHEVAPDNSWIKCLVCGMVSYHPMDVAQLYCGLCHDYHPIQRYTSAADADEVKAGGPVDVPRSPGGAGS